LIKYISTRGGSLSFGFKEILTSGLAANGGLYIPDSLPKFTLNKIKSWKDLSYQDLVYNVISPYTGDAIPEDRLKEIINDSYSEFRSKEIAPLKKLYENQYLLELFHGPTLAFKDFALQLLGRLLDYVLSEQKKNVVIIGATSGDTGSAAIEGCRHSSHVSIFMLHPHGRITDVQRKQMTTTDSKNVHNIAVEGTFDDCQNIVKQLFQNEDFCKNKHLVAVNSINWARIMAQIVYYFSAYLKLDCPDKISFSVPTGNFGDIFAGYIGFKMGLPIEKLIVATNTNDILHRFFQENDYSTSEVTTTISPSMDIQISSNFERLLFDLHDSDGSKVNELMKKFQQTGSLSVEPEILEKAQQIFDSYKVDGKGILESIKKVFDDTGEIVDPHTAIGVAAALANKEDIPIVTLATAHPAKFPSAIREAGLEEVTQPTVLKDIIDKEEKYEILGNNKLAIIDFINSRL